MACGYYIESLSGVKHYFTALLGATAGTAGNVPTHFIASDIFLTDFKCVVVHPNFTSSVLMADLAKKDEIKKRKIPLRTIFRSVRHSSAGSKFKFTANLSYPSSPE